jgi:hypothetical protein
MKKLSRLQDEVAWESRFRERESKGLLGKKLLDVVEKDPKCERETRFWKEVSYG